jgi:hexosaminidase
MQKILFFVCLLLACKSKETTQPAAINRPTGEQLALRWELIPTGTDNEFDAKFTIVNQSEDTFPRRGWTIYFNQIAGSPQPNRGKVQVQRITGDYCKLQPIAGFDEVAPKDSTIFTVRYQGNLRKYTHGPLGFYIVFENTDGSEQEPEVLTQVTILPLPNDQQMVQRGKPTVPLATWYYNQNKGITPLPDSVIPSIIPRPLKLTAGKDTLRLNASWTIRHEKGFVNEANYLSDHLKNIFGKEFIKEENITTDKQSIVLKLDPQIAQAEGYKLTANAAEGILIEGKDAAGVFYGVQSLLAWLPPLAFQGGQNSLTIREVQIEDAPRFGYRGLHLDVSRNFNRKETVLRVLDLMGFYKLNKLHLHLADDEGWRLDIPALPQLTQVGAQRGHTRTEADRLYPAYGSGPFVEAADTYGSGYYTRSDFVEILKKATSRHIEVISEFDTPGHSRAAIKAMQNRYRALMKFDDKTAAEEYLLHDPADSSKYTSAQGYSDNVMCICKEAPYRFWETVMDEVQSLYKEAGAPLKTIHIGGDEVPGGSWAKSPICNEFRKKNPQYKTVEDLQIYFLRRVNEMLLKRGLNTGGWEEIALKKAAKGWVPNTEFVDKKLLAWVWISAWDSDGLVYRMANAGFPVVVCNVPNFYFDLAYNADAQEPGLTWGGTVGNREPFAFIPDNVYATGAPATLSAGMKFQTLTPTGQKNILGLQAQLWSETLKGPEMLEYYLMPKLLGLAERAWSPQPAWAKASNATQRKTALDKAWNVFANTAGQRDLLRINYLFGGWNYRIAPPGAVIVKDSLRANVEFPGLQIRYTTDGSEPDANSTLYEKPVPVSGTVKMKVFDAKGRSSRTSTVQTPLNQ